MKAFVLIGGGEISKRETETIDIEALKLTKKKKPKVLFIPIAASDSETYADTFIKYYSSLGAKVNVCYMSKEKTSIIAEKIKSSDAIYLSGGDTMLLISAFHKKPDLIRLLKEKVVIGLSAGALALSKYSLITKDKDNPQTKIVKGLGLIHMTIEVHYDGNNTEISKVLKNHQVFAIKENSCMILSERFTRYIGDIEVFYKNEKNR